MTRSEMLERYKLAKAELHRDHQIEAGQAAALTYAAFATKTALDERSAFQSAAHAAKLMCIASGGFLPILLVLHMMGKG